MGANFYKQGEWNAICDVCGLKKKSGDIRLRWDGLRVCKQDWEPRHPQDLIRAKPEKAPPPWTRPEAPDTFTVACDLWSSSDMADFGSADCMTVGGNTSLPLIIETYHPLAIAAIAIAGRSLAGYVEAPYLFAFAAAPAPAPAPPGSPALKFNVSSNSEYLPLTSVGGM